MNAPDRGLTDGGSAEPDAVGPGELVVAIRELLWGVDRAWQSLAARARLGITETVAMTQIYAAGGPVESRRIRERTGLTGAAVSSLIDRLEERGLALRVRSHDDRRVVRVELTPAGRELTDSLFAPLTELVRTSGAGDLEPGELALRVRALTYTTRLLAQVAEASPRTR